MADSLANYGIFIRSNNMSEAFKCECISQLQQICNGIISRVVNDLKHDGLRVYFKDKASVAVVLNRKSLIIAGRSFYMYPLITHLTIHNILPTAKHDIQKDLYDQLQRCIGPVLNVNEVPMKEHPDIGSGNWRAVLEIPEAEDLEVFRRKGLPNEMYLKLPYIEDSLKVTFFCCKCETNGHILQKCTKIDTVQDYSNKKVLTPKELNEAAKAELLGNVLEFASKVGEEEVKRHSEDLSTSKIERTKHKRSEEFSTSNIDLTKRIKIELEDTMPFKSSADKVGGNKLSRNNSGDDTRFDAHPKASSTTTEDDEIKATYCHPIQLKREPLDTWTDVPRKRMSFVDYKKSRPCTNPKQHVDFFSRQLKKITTQLHLLEGSEDDRNSLNAPTSSQPETITQTGNAHSSVTAVREPTTPTRRRAPAVGRIEIPPNSRVVECIQEAGGKISLVELEAFFQHVKKKGNVMKIAKQYTNDVNALKEQLSNIVRIYYHSPLTGTKQDRVFMKWLQQLVERFDGPPVTRRDKKVNQRDFPASGSIKSETEQSSHSFASEEES